MQSHHEDSQAFRMSKGKYSLWDMVIFYDTDRVPLWLLDQNRVYNIDDLK